jgi:metallo-beta-lactamase class B
MRMVGALLCTLVLIITGVQAQTVKEFLAAVTKKWTAPFEPFQLMGNIYYIGTDGIATYYFVGARGAMVAH